MKDRLFARIREEGDVLLVWCADEGEKQALIEFRAGDVLHDARTTTAIRPVLVRFGGEPMSSCSTGC